MSGKLVKLRSLCRWMGNRNRPSEVDAFHGPDFAEAGVPDELLAANEQIAVRCQVGERTFLGVARPTCWPWKPHYHCLQASSATQMSSLKVDDSLSRLSRRPGKAEVSQDRVVASARKGRRTAGPSCRGGLERLKYRRAGLSRRPGRADVRYRVVASARKGRRTAPGFRVGPEGSTYGRACGSRGFCYCAFTRGTAPRW